MARLLVLGAAALLGASALASEPTQATLVWRLNVVGTPGFMGPPKISDPQYTAPVPISVNKTDTVPCQFEEAMGNFEAHVSSEGRVVSVHSRHEPVAGNACQSKHVFPIIRGWRFKPASFEGKPMAVFLSVGVENEAWGS